MKKGIFILSAVLTAFSAVAQFDGDGGTPNSKAIAKDDVSITSWAKGIELSRDTVVTYGKVYDAIGKPSDDNLRVVSLGNKGTALVTFDRPIVNDFGNDFVVFENAFDSTFMELAFVEVSSDGKNFFRFPSESSATEEKATQTTSHYKNLAGKYSYKYGVGFDLDDIEDNELLDKNNIRFVRLVDVEGGVDKDSKGNVIYEYDEKVYLGSSGFDLAGIGIINGGQPYKIADFNDLLTKENTYDILSEQTSDGSVADEDDDEDILYYYKNFYSNGLVFSGIGDMSWGSINPISWLPSNITTNVDSLINKASENGHNGYDKTFYTAASLSGADGENTYMVGYYSEWNDTPYTYIEHVSVFTDDSTDYFPQGVYVNQSLNSYRWANDDANATNNGEKGWFKLIATGFNADGDTTGTSEIYLIDNRESSYIGNRTDWRYLDLTPLGKVNKVHFSMASNWASGWGMNIASYVLTDNFSYTNDEIKKVIPVVEEVTACDSYTMKGHTFTESGIYSLYDTILNLTITTSYYDTIEVELSPENPTYEFDGVTYSEPQEVVIEKQTEAGCDSVIVLKISVKNILDDISDNQISIYPNPATTNVFVASTIGSVIEIADISGKNVLTATATKEITEINNLNKGVYFVTITTKTNRITKKLIIK